MIEEYYNLTGNLIQLNQSIPFTINGSLEVLDLITDNITLYEEKCMFTNGIIFPKLIDELSSYFTQWTITLKMSSSRIGELWQYWPIVSIQKNSTNIFEIYSDNDILFINELGDFEVYNYLYKGVNPTVDNNLGLKKYLAYKLWYEGSKQQSPFLNADTLEISHTFSRDDFPSGDLILRTLDGTLYNTFIVDFVISTTESYTGKNYRIKTYPESGSLIFLTLNYRIKSIPYPGPNSNAYQPLFTLNYKIDPIPYPGPEDNNYQQLLTFNYKINLLPYPGPEDNNYQQLLALNYKINLLSYPGPEDNSYQQLLALNYKINLLPYPGPKRDTAKLLFTLNYKINLIPYPGTGDNEYQQLLTLNYKINPIPYPGPNNNTYHQLLTLNYNIGYSNYPGPGRDKAKQLLTLNYKIDPIPYPGTGDNEYKTLLTLNYKAVYLYPSDRDTKEILYLKYEVQDGFIFPPNVQSDVLVFSYPEPEKQDDLLIIKLFDELILSYPDPEKLDDILSADKDIDTILDYHLMIAYPDPDAVVDDSFEIYLHNVDVKDLNELQRIFAYPYPVKLYDILHLNMDNDIEVYDKG